MRDRGPDRALPHAHRPGRRGPSPDAPLKAFYRERARRFEEARDRARKRADDLSNLRLILFAGALILAWLGVLAGGFHSTWTGSAAVLLLGFGILVLLHRRARSRAREREALRAVNARTLARLGRRWDDVSEVAPPGDAGPGEGHPFAADLGLTGRASLLHLAGETATSAGRRRLLRWLLEPADPEEGARRQSAAWELADRVEFRDRLIVLGRAAGAPDPEALARFLAWAEGEAWLARRPALRLAAWALPAATVVLGALQVAGILGAPWWLLPVAAALVLGYAHGRAVHGRFGAVSDGEAGAGRLAPLVEHVADAGLHGPELRRRTAALTGEGGSAREGLRRLELLSALADVRFSQFHVVFQALFLWDVHVLRGLEAWRERYGGRARAWLGALAELDALAALGRLVHMHPDWCRPRLRGEPDAAEEGALLDAQALGHPLLPPDRCVRNDLRLGPPGTFLRVTGSNMAGKSTLLRAVGLAVVLARAGGPAPASGLDLGPLRPWTSLEVRDSPAGGVSYFLAELRRLRRMLDAAREPGTVLFLLDEPLRGTNPEERRVGARRVLRLLLEAGAVGVVTTHDPAIADAEDLRGRRTDAHLGEAEEEGGVVAPGGEPPGLTFDYRLRPGLAPRTNALRLMDALGLGEPGAGERASRRRS